MATETKQTLSLRSGVNKLTQIHSAKFKALDYASKNINLDR
jgi:hypothetical protein